MGEFTASLGSTKGGQPSFCIRSRSQPPQWVSFSGLEMDQRSQPLTEDLIPTHEGLTAAYQICRLASRLSFSFSYFTV